MGQGRVGGMLPLAALVGGGGFGAFSWAAALRFGIYCSWVSTKLSRTFTCARKKDNIFRLNTVGT